MASLIQSIQLSEDEPDNPANLTLGEDHLLPQLLLSRQPGRHHLLSDSTSNKQTLRDEEFSKTFSSVLLSDCRLEILENV